MYERGWSDGLPGRAAHSRTRRPHADGHRPRPPRRRRDRSARPRGVHGREGRDQRGPGRVSARVPARGASPRSKARAPTSSTCTDCSPPRGSADRSSWSTARSARAIGMNSGINALGPGNRANATIGRALQLVIRNVGGGRPGEVDRATLGQPGQVHVLLRRARGRVRGSRCTSSGASGRTRARSRCSPARACAASSTSCPAPPSR